MDEKEEKIKVLHVQIEAYRSMEKERTAHPPPADDNAALKEQILKLEGLLGKCRETLKFVLLLL